MAMRSHEDSFINDINVTPFVDVLLVLLIIFMVTAPVMTRSVGVNLPKDTLSQEEPPKQNDKTVSLVLGLDEREKIIFKKKAFTFNHFSTRFADLTKNLKIDKIYIQADKSSKYENLLNLMVFLKNNGHENIGFVFEQE